MNQTFFIAQSKLEKNKKALLVAAVFCILLFIAGFAGALAKQRWQITISNLILLIPFVSCFYLCSTTNRTFFETHLLTRGVERKDYFTAGVLACGIPSFILLLLSWLAFIVLHVMSAEPAPELRMTAAKAAVILMLLIMDLYLLLCLAYSSGIFGYKFSNFALAVFPFAFSFKPERVFEFFQVSYAFPHFMHDPLRPTIYANLGGHVHMAENLAVGVLVLLATFRIFQQRDIG